MLYKLNIKERQLTLVRLVTTKDNRFKELEIKTVDFDFKFTIKSLTTPQKSEQIVKILNELFQPYISDISGLYISIDSDFFQIEKSEFIDPYLQKDKEYIDREVSLFLTDSPAEYQYGYFANKENFNAIIVILRKDISDHFNKIFRALNGNIQIKNYGLDYKTSSNSSKFIKTKHSIQQISKAVVVPLKQQQTTTQPVIKNILEENKKHTINKQRKSVSLKNKKTIYISLTILIVVSIFFTINNFSSDTEKNVIKIEDRVATVIQSDTVKVVPDSLKIVSDSTALKQKIIQPQFNIYSLLQRLSNRANNLIIIEDNQVAISCDTAVEADSLITLLDRENNFTEIKKLGIKNKIVLFQVKMISYDTEGHTDAEIVASKNIFTELTAKFQNKYDYLTFTDRIALTELLAHLQNEKVIFSKLKITQRNNTIFMMVDFD